MKTLRWSGLVVVLAIGVSACGEDGGAVRIQQGLSDGGAASAAPNPDPDPGPDLCDPSTPPCSTYCSPLQVDPGVPGTCCDSYLMSTCYDAGYYLPGDRDGDGVPDHLDNCVVTANPDQANHDADTWGDACDNCPYVTNQDQADYDYDRIGNVCDSDLDNDGVDNALDNCPERANADQANVDGDLFGDACDNCPQHQNDDQANSDADSRGDACDWDGYRETLNCEAMMIAAPECSSSGYALIDGCINRDAPPPPSIDRGVSSARDDLNDPNNQIYRLPIDEKVSTSFIPWPGAQSIADVPSAGETQTLPFLRTSNDGRLVLASSPFFGAIYQDRRAFAVYRPELIGEGGRLGGAQRVYSPPAKGILPELIFGNANTEPGHATLCDISGAERVPGREPSMARNPRACTTTGGESGDCYDVTYLSQRVLNGQRDFSSLDVTVFVRDPKTANATIPSAANQESLIFPGGTLNPDLSWQPTASAFSAKRSSAWGAQWTRDCSCEALPCASGSQPLSFDIFEPTTTADGRLFVVNFGGVGGRRGVGLYYAIAPQGQACKAAGFKLFKPLSCLPSDSRAQGYGLAKGVVANHNGRPAFRDSKGAVIPPGNDMPGAYMWLDRKGKNIVYAEVNEFRDAWRASSRLPAALDSKSPSSWGNFPDQHPSAAGNGVVALGAWTQGKIVVMDNLLNPTDWTGGANRDFWTGAASLPVNFEMPLYKDAPRWIRPVTSSMLNAMENQLNYLNAHSPTLPFDVVWRFGTDTSHNAEVVFDEYMLNHAFVIAHMNSPHTRFGTRDERFPDDGFAPSSTTVSMRAGDLAGFRFRQNPNIQNAATSVPWRAPFASEPPPTLRLRGGARVEPVALGGVRGKGVFFDGVNDHMDMGFKNPNHRSWFYGIWLDPRAGVISSPRTIFYWPDGSWVGASTHQLMAYDAATQSVKTLGIPSDKRLLPGQYSHLGLKLQDANGGRARSLTFYIQGEPIGQLSFNNAQGFSMDLSYTGGWSWFVVGDPGPSLASPGYGWIRVPFKGWIDEFRIYALDSANSGSHFEEFICNLAMGSLLEEAGQPRCEQLQLQAQGHPVDVPPQVGLRCADKAHKDNADPSCQRSAHLGIAPLDPVAPRPSFLGNQFCATCHLPNHPMVEMSLGALSADVMNKEDDPRRQPMDVPAYLGGQPYPTYDPLVLPGQPSWSGYIDQWIFSQGKVH